MDEKDKIIDLSEKKPLQALIYVLLVAIASLTSVVVYQYGAPGRMREEYEGKVKLKEYECQKTLQQKDLVIASKDDKIEQLNQFVIQRSDAFYKEQRDDLKSVIQESREIKDRRARLAAERNAIVKKNTSKLNTLENSTIQTNEN